jgi:hypothetical protein
MTLRTVYCYQPFNSFRYGPLVRLPLRLPYRTEPYRLISFLLLIIQGNRSTCPRFQWLKEIPYRYPLLSLVETVELIRQ